MDRSRKVAKLLSRVATKRTCRKNVKRFSKTIVEMKYLHYMERFDRFKVWTRRLKLRDIQLVLLLPLSLPSLRPFPPLDPLRSMYRRLIADRAHGEALKLLYAGPGPARPPNVFWRTLGRNLRLFECICTL